MPIIQNTQRIQGPRNDRSVAVAKERLAALTPLAQRELSNAMAVNGIPSLVYKRLTQGRVCSCSMHTTDAPDVPLFDDDGNASPNHIASVLTGGRFAIHDYGRAPNRGNSAETEPTLIEHATAIPLDDSDTDMLGDPLGVNVTDLDPMGYDIDPDAYDNGACPVCFGTGIVGGFVLIGGLRVIVDATYPDLVLTGCNRDQMTKPHSLNWFAAGTVEWTLTVPMYSRVSHIKVWNSKQEVDVQVELFNGVSWTALTDPSVLVTGAPSRCRIHMPQDGVVTHIELQVMQADPITIDFPHLSRTGDVMMLDTTQDVQLVISPLLGSIAPGDIVADGCYGKLWRIREVTENADAMNRHMGWDCGARIVQPYERINQLFAPTARQLATANFNQRQSSGRGNYLKF